MANFVAMERNLISDSEHSLQMIVEGDIAGAVRLSGETLADDDAEWTAAFNSNRDTAPALDTLLRAAYAHISALSAAGEVAQAFSTSLIVLYASVIDRSEGAPTIHGRLTLWLVGLDMLQQLVDRLYGDTAPDGDTAAHIRAAITYMSSMLHRVYRQAIACGIDSPVVNDAYTMLSSLSRVIQWPVVNVNGTHVDITADPTPLMADLTGRLRALALFTIGQ